METSEERKRSNNTGITIFLVLAIITIGYLAYNNYILNQKIKKYNEQIEYNANYINEFHNNLYAQIDCSYTTFLSYFTTIKYN